MFIESEYPGDSSWTDSDFQGFCRELYSECVEAVVLTLPPLVGKVFRRQSFTARQLDGANARYESIRADFERFDFDLQASLAINAANANRITLLGHLNLWRNYVAHDKTSSPTQGGPLGMAALAAWRSACDGFASELDRVMYNEVIAFTEVAPW